MKLNRPNRSTFHVRLDKMVAELRDEITGGKRPAGSFLPSEVELGSRYQLSKNSVRKGLELLVEEQLIEKVPSVGTRVCAPAVRGDMTIRLGMYPSLMEQTKLDRLLTEFHAAYPHIQVQTVPLPFVKYHDTMMEYLENGMLDAFTINQHDFSHFGAGECLDWLEPMDPSPGHYPFLRKAFTNEESLYAQPFVFSPVVLCYNRDHFAECNVREPDSSWRWNDLMDAAERLTTDDCRFGFYFYLLSLNRWPVFLLQSGEKIRQGKAGGVHLRGTKLAEALELCRDVAHSKAFLPPYVAEGIDDVEQLFLQEKVSMIMTTYFSLHALDGAGFTFDISPLPYSETPATLLSVVGLGINRKSERREAARALIDFLLSEQAQLTVRQTSHSIPSLIKAAEWNGQGTVSHASRYAMYREIIPTFKIISDLNITSAELEVMHQELKMYWSKMEREEDVLSRVESALSLAAK